MPRNKKQKKPRRVVLGDGRMQAWSSYGKWEPSSVKVDNGISFSKRLIGKRIRLVAEVLE